MVEGKGKGSATYEQVALSLLDLYKPKKKICDTPSSTNAKIGADTDKMNREGDTKIQNSGEQQGEDVFKKVDLKERPLNLMKARLEQTLHMHDDFIATVYSNVHESLKHTTEEYLHLKNPLCSSGTLSSMKNLKDNFTFDDQFINDNPTEEDPGKINVETKVESMVTVPIHQASSLVSPLSTLAINLTPLKPVPPSIGIGPQSALLRVIPNFAIAHELCAGSLEVIPSSKNKVKVFIVIGKQDRRKERTKAEKDLRFRGVIGCRPPSISFLSSSVGTLVDVISASDEELVLDVTDWNTSKLGCRSIIKQKELLRLAWSIGIDSTSWLRRENQLTWKCLGGLYANEHFEVLYVQHRRLGSEP
nr:hypothetical protein [Tanacetum cinerariifolium]